MLILSKNGKNLIKPTSGWVKLFYVQVVFFSNGLNWLKLGGYNLSGLYQTTLVHCKLVCFQRTETNKKNTCFDEYT